MPVQPAEHRRQSGMQITGARFTDTVLAGGNAGRADAPCLVDDAIDIVTVDLTHGLVAPSLRQSALPLDRIAAVLRICQAQLSDRVAPPACPHSCMLIGEATHQSGEAVCCPVLDRVALALLAALVIGHPIRAGGAAPLALPRPPAGPPP